MATIRGRVSLARVAAELISPAVSACAPLRPVLADIKVCFDWFNPSIAHQHHRSLEAVFTASAKIRELPVNSPKLRTGRLKRTQLAHKLARSLATHTPRPALRDPLQRHPNPTPRQAHSPPDLPVVPTLPGQHRDQTIALDRVHLCRPSRPQKAGLKLRGSGDLICAASTHALSVDRPGRYGRHDKRGAASIAGPA